MFLLLFLLMFLYSTLSAPTSLLLNRWGDIFGIDDQSIGGHFQRDNWQGVTFGETVHQQWGHFQRYSTISVVFLTVLLLFVNHCMPSHIIYALYLFLSCLSEDQFVWYRQNSSFEYRYDHFPVLIDGSYSSNLIFCTPCIYLFCAPS